MDTHEDPQEKWAGCSRETLERSAVTHQTVGHTRSVGRGPLADCPDSALVDPLAQLTSAGVIERHRTPGWPPRVRYTLTARGRALEPVVRSMWEWGTAQQQDTRGQSVGPSDRP
ncbi:hypothetical protein DT019_35970 [Streptomyces sp. SDr-06]|uniref:winged helix-turn-helix transcriptional regulator n=1 Tax=Streptomyces sp. SDr-06 TaxID=2267702 RepID=UPI000DE90C0F|nr:winged helix-turn-helix transcriptional regulator [Streptomyces sp. SDr-06]RCH61916.1 hypothetical protein DT019_35970 [Streptomyces sp. SDr-06]